jgi:hypothetical protein
MKTRRNQGGGAKAKPMNELNSLTRSMGRLRFGAKPKSSRFGTKATPKSIAKPSVIKTIPHKTKKHAKPVKTLGRFVSKTLVKRNNNTLNTERFEPARYIKKVGAVFQGLGSVRDRIEMRGNQEFLVDFDIIVGKIHDGLPLITYALGNPSDEKMNEENIDDILEDIDSVGEELVKIAKGYRTQVRTSRTNLSELQLHLISVAEAVNKVLVQSVSTFPKPGAAAAAVANTNVDDLVAQLGKMNVKESSVDDLSSLLAGLGL